MANKQEIINDFFEQLFAQDLKAVFKDKTPKAMMASQVDSEGWYNWKPVAGTYETADYRKIEKKFNVVFPESFVEWHRLYFFCMETVH